MAELEKSLTVTWTFLAKSQLQHILEFWIERNATTTYSERLLDKVSEKTKQLSKHPASALKTSISEIRKSALGNYSIYYKKAQSSIIIVAFWDNRQKPSTLVELLKKRS
jgi:plasmid stabilization system protein ParE